MCPHGCTVPDGVWHRENSAPRTRALCEWASLAVCNITIQVLSNVCPSEYANVTLGSTDALLQSAQSMANHAICTSADKLGF